MCIFIYSAFLTAIPRELEEARRHRRLRQVMNVLADRLSRC